MNLSYHVIFLVTAERILESDEEICRILEENGVRVNIVRNKIDSDIRAAQKNLLGDINDLDMKIANKKNGVELIRHYEAERESKRRELENVHQSVCDVVAYVIIVHKKSS